MKHFLFLFTFYLLNIGTLFSQENIKIYGNSKPWAEIIYYYNLDKTQKNILKTSINYNLEINIDTLSAITFKYKDGYCEQTLNLIKLKEYVEKHNIYEIRNDLTTLRSFSCERMDGMMKDSVKHFGGEWKNKDLKLTIYSNETFDLDYSNSFGSFQKQGVYKINNSKTIKLKTIFIINKEINTYEDSNEEIRLHYNKDKLIITEGKTKLKRINN